MTVSVHHWLHQLLLAVTVTRCRCPKLSRTAGSCHGKACRITDSMLCVRSPAAGGFRTSSARCQECQDHSICYAVALMNVVTAGVAGALRLVGTGIGGVLGYLVMLRTGLATRCAPSACPVCRAGTSSPSAHLQAPAFVFLFAQKSHGSTDLHQTVKLWNQSHNSVTSDRTAGCGIDHNQRCTGGCSSVKLLSILLLQSCSLAIAF